MTKEQLKSMDYPQLLEFLEQQQTEIDDLRNQYENELFELNYVLQNSPGSIYWKDTNGIYRGNNKFSSELMLSLGLSGELIGKTDYELFTKEVADHFREADLKVLSGQSLITEETTVLPDGRRLIQLSSKIPWRDKDNHIIGIIGNTVDITELKQTQEELRRESIALAKAQEANEAKDNFILNIEHDIRTPFSGIYGLSEYLVGETEGEIKEFLQMIEKATKELLNYCNNILEYSRLHSGVTPLLDRKFDLKQLAEKVLIMEKPAAIHKQLDMYFEYDSKLPKLFISDEYRIQRILINLISNAIKFTKEGHVALKIEQLKQKARRCIVQITVSDTGIGIPESQQTKIFERFIRLSPSNQNYYKGAGLGLTSVKNLLESLDGELELTSQVGKGSAFTCILPLKISLHDEAL
jgi:two-component system, OmpR family, aerobic respiration control sensor histidine kinase ArcB